MGIHNAMVVMIALGQPRLQQPLLLTLHGDCVAGVRADAGDGDAAGSGDGRRGRRQHCLQRGRKVLLPQLDRCLVPIGIRNMWLHLGTPTLIQFVEAEVEFPGKIFSVV